VCFRRPSFGSCDLTTMPARAAVAPQLEFSASAGLSWLATSTSHHHHLQQQHGQQPEEGVILPSLTDGKSDEEEEDEDEDDEEEEWPAPMQNARKDFAAAVVRRGGTFTDQVVVVGGVDDSGPMDSVEIFDPSVRAISEENSTFNSLSIIVKRCCFPNNRNALTFVATKLPSTKDYRN
jgi:hypothetical protein